MQIQTVSSYKIITRKLRKIGEYTRLWDITFFYNVTAFSTLFMYTNNLSIFLLYFVSSHTWHYF